MDTGGFAHCIDCREYLWIGGDTDGLCALCLERAAQAEPPPEPEPEPIVVTEPSQHERERLVAELQAKGRDVVDPFDALVDYCQAVARKRRARSM